MKGDPVRLSELRLSRQAMTAAEAALWHVLRDGRFHGFKFRRMAQVGDTVAPYLCPALRLAILTSPDGPATANDLRQRATLARAGLRLILLPEALVLSDLPGCLVRLTREVTP
ncbi:hypothetical protein MASR2M74_16110 [Paracoccaceae bacterium]